MNEMAEFSPVQLATIPVGEYADLFSVLGMHEVNGKLVVRCYLPGALAVRLCVRDDETVLVNLQGYGNGLFAAVVPRRRKRFHYVLQVDYPQLSTTLYDPYQYGSLLSAEDIYLFAEGKQEQAYRFLGANWREVDGVEGVWFGVWAPNARQVSLLGDFNHWNGSVHGLRFHPGAGIWEIFIPGVAPGAHYKFRIVGQDGVVRLKADPYAKAMQPAPDNASLVPSPQQFDWQDANWLAQRRTTPWHVSAMSIYEVHLPSWRRGENNHYLNYAELADTLIPYALEMGFTHLQFMPISEYPFDGSWGYQPVGLYAPTYRLGETNQLKYFINACHQAGLGVLLDWVPAHFPTDEHGLVCFDGSCLYEHEDPRLGYHPDWNTLIYNYGRPEVLSFLFSNARYWLEEFHFDGLRIDAVSSMLYLDYSREPGQWLPNEFGGRENLLAIHFLRELNARLYCSVPGICMIAEESTAWPGVTRPTNENGLGFGFKWNMGWMNDSLNYLQKDPIYRKFHHHQITFSLMYCFSEQFILSLSHDEVVHGKGSLINKIPGDRWQKMATLRAFYGLMWGHPGKKLLFMGNEFAQWREWNHDQSLDWHLTGEDDHTGMQRWIADLNRLYRQHPALTERDDSPGSFGWLDCDNAEQSIFVFIRYAQEYQQHLIFVVNMTPQTHHGYRVGVPLNGAYREVLNSDSHFYGGSNQGVGTALESEPHQWQGMANSVVMVVPPLGCVVLAPESEHASR